jgi:hypothetical protein
MKLGETVHFDVTTRGDSGVVDADSAPTFSVFENATDTPILADVAMTKRTALTGNYRGTFDATTGNGFESGKWYNVIVTGIVGGVTDKTVALTFLLRAYSIDDIASTLEGGSVEVVQVGPLSSGGLLVLYKNGDYKLADNRAIRVTLPAGTYPDITGATCRLGVTKSKDNTGGFVVEASAQSGSAVADQTIDFELDHATETGDLEPAYAYGWTCRVVYPGVDPLTQWDNLDPISGKVKVLEDRVGNAAP